MFTSPNSQPANNYKSQQQYPLNAPYATTDDYNSQSSGRLSFSQVDDFSHQVVASHSQLSMLLYHHPKNSEETVSL